MGGEDMKLYGTDACADCILAKKLFKKYNQSYEWIDVSDIPDFEGDIPRLEMEICDIPSTSIHNKVVITGLAGISKYLRELQW
ncbi:unnamed protein product [marine sediment metagenome]|uniref:Glutaredoxin domain-containing protein n=1 Tax=marine sediment metagenome TaxID=412755 RepID=X1IMW4_9ZZZZ